MRIKKNFIEVQFLYNVVLVWMWISFALSACPPTQTGRLAVPSLEVMIDKGRWAKAKMGSLWSHWADVLRHMHVDKIKTSFLLLHCINLIHVHELYTHYFCVCVYMGVYVKACVCKYQMLLVMYVYMVKCIKTKFLILYVSLL